MSPTLDMRGPLAAVLDWGGADLEGFLDGVELRLARCLEGYGGALSEAAASTLAAGGKRLRPLLVFVCGPAADRDNLIPGATAVELIHMATLIHDDLVDGAATRRGQPTVAEAWGSQRALASGDFLLARGFGVLAESGQNAAVRDLAAACLELARGELAQRQAMGDPSVTVERYLERCRLKTASLFEAACRMGARAARRPAPVVAALAYFGARIGLAFQILDDILDLAGDPAKTGKAVGTDLREGTITLPLILAAAERPGLVEKALAAGSDDEVAAICATISASGALGESRLRAERLVAEAKSEIGLAGLDEEQLEILGGLADGVVERFA